MTSKESLATSTTSNKKRRHRRKSSDRSTHVNQRADGTAEPKHDAEAEAAQQQQDRRTSEQPGELLVVQSSDNLGRRFSHAATQKMTTPVLYTSEHSWQPPSVTAEAAPAEVKEDEGKMPSESKKGRKKSVRGLKMPDGTYVGLEEKNKYLRAMQKEYLRCDYVPFCILASLAVVVIALIYLYTYRPDIFNSLIEKIRRLLGLNQVEDEETSAHPLRQDTTKTPGASTDGMTKTPSGATIVGSNNLTVY